MKIDPKDKATWPRDDIHEFWIREKTEKRLNRKSLYFEFDDDWEEHFVQEADHGMYDSDYDMDDVEEIYNCDLDGWIKVEDGLPESGVQVNVVCWDSPTNNIRQAKGEIRDGAWDKSPLVTVTHWQPESPLPESTP